MQMNSFATIKYDIIHYYCVANLNWITCSQSHVAIVKKLNQIGKKARAQEREWIVRERIWRNAQRKKTKYEKKSIEYFSFARLASRPCAHKWLYFMNI